MTQTRLSGLAMISIVNKLIKKLDFFIIGEDGSRWQQIIFIN
jgi:hypothetical protein